jgi:RimJ/RimL family protein N-acetyltransferase
MLGAKEEWNKGYAQEAKMLLLEYAFQTLNLRKVCSAAFAENKGSIKHNLNCGYQIEGKRKKQFYRDGKYHDETILSVFKEDWLKLKG